MRTMPHQRQEFHEQHLAGLTYPEIAAQFGVSTQCVRYWCRRLRVGGDPQTVYPGRPPGVLSSFDPKVHYCILRLRLQHPRWGPSRVLAHLERRPSLHGLALPCEASIGRYLHQWARFRRPARGKAVRPHQPTTVHQRWQLDFKLEIALQDGTLVNLVNIHDPVGEVCLGSFAFPGNSADGGRRRPNLAEVRSALRACFQQWGTLPAELQTDGEPVLAGQPQDSFPCVFRLWLKGLGIKHLVIRPGRPTDNAEIERCNRTIMDYAVTGNEHLSLAELADHLLQAVHELAFELPSWAAGCHGRPPVEAHPELLQKPRPFQREHELALFSLQRVDEYLASLRFERRVSRGGQVEVGGDNHRYYVGRQHGQHVIQVRYVADTREFVFYDPHDSSVEIRRWPARWLDVSDITGLSDPAESVVPQQLPLPLCFPTGVSC